MALNCKKCGALVNETSSICNKCGYAGEELGKISKGKIIISFVLIVIFGYFANELFFVSDETKVQRIEQALLELKPFNNDQKRYILSKRLLEYAEKDKTLYDPIKAKKNFIEAKNKWETIENHFNKMKEGEKAEQDKIESRRNLEFSTIYDAKQAIKERLKDADSAEFRNVVYVDNVIPVACGEVNSKNSFGGFAGFSKFVSTGSLLTVLQTDGDVFIEAWNKLCVGH